MSERRLDDGCECSKAPETGASNTTATSTVNPSSSGEAALPPQPQGQWPKQGCQLNPGGARFCGMVHSARDKVILASVLSAACTSGVDRAQHPHRSAAVCTGASQSESVSSSIIIWSSSMSKVGRPASGTVQLVRATPIEAVRSLTRTPSARHASR